MNDYPISHDIALEPLDNRRLANLCGQFNENISQVERFYGVEINNRGNAFQIIGATASANEAIDALKRLYQEAKTRQLTPDRIRHLLKEEFDHSRPETTTAPATGEIRVTTRRGVVEGRTASQRSYLHNIASHDISFAVGPAGTGKTYLAVASAVAALDSDQVKRLILVRPAVEAGERLGFLPGDLTQKVDPYLRPLYDALYEMLGFEKVAKLIERHVIEVAPLAYMRGRSLNNSFIILDEAQNTTMEQMKMFLTRIGFGSKAVIAGDITQVDLPRSSPSGLRHAVEILKSVEGISITFFSAKDVVRHPLVQRIVEAYERGSGENTPDSN